MWPNETSNAVYLRDHCGPAVNASLMPGVKVGPYSVIGAGVVLQEDAPDGTLLSVQHSWQTKSWGARRYN